MLIEPTEKGFYCRAGDFYVDPWRPVRRAVVTHAHADHARPGSGSYLGARTGERVMRRRLGEKARIETLPFGESTTIDGVRVSFHPAGHILGSAQVRLEHRGEVWVVSGDYKTEPDPTCAAFEPVRCRVFITESTFGLPIYRWPPQDSVRQEVDAWWRANREAGKTSLLLAYALGKAQRLLAGLDRDLGPIFTHGAVEALCEDYRASGVDLPPTTYVGGLPRDTKWNEGLVIAPPSALGTPWARRFGDLSAGFASGWMRIRGPRRRRAVDRGFVLSDHVDWPSLLAAIDATGAEEVWATHGYSDALVRWLRERGRDAKTVSTRFVGELETGEVETGEVEDGAKGAETAT